jgi:pimeloyl-ACP methyl ester carboxylesterase
MRSRVRRPAPPPLGRPGASGLTLSRLGEFVPDGAGDAYDWIGFDPRGVGSSVPAISCDPDYFSPSRPEYVPTTEALEQTWLARPGRTRPRAAGTPARCCRT